MKNAKSQKSTRKIRYAVVGLGHISQVAFLPGVRHSGNSEITAAVTGDEKKAVYLTKKYGVKNIFKYEDYDRLLKSGLIDAVYIALPNEMHLDYTLRALKAGIHVLLEKPMAVSEAECKKIIRAAKSSSAKLMVAYRLHFEPASLKVLELVRAGKIGNPRLFSSVFCQTVPVANHRAHHGFWAGPVADMGPYPINAARTLFGAEPIEVWAAGSHRSDLPPDLQDTVTVCMRFPEERIAQFTVSYAMPGTNDYRVLGDTGEIRLDPGFTYGSALNITTVIKGKTKKLHVPATDQFGSELKYFSDCILNNRKPEPDAEEGFCDVRIVAAIEKAIKTGRVQKLSPYKRRTHPKISQKVKLPPIPMPTLQNMVDVVPPTGG